jgi:hypothetical protein
LEDKKLSNNIETIIEDELIESNIKLNLGQVNDIFECLLDYRDMKETLLKYHVENQSDGFTIKFAVRKLTTINDLISLLYDENKRYNDMALGD